MVETGMAPLLTDVNGGAVPNTGTSILVFLPGLSGNHRQWDVLGPRLREEFEVVAYASPILAHERFGSRRPSVTDLATALVEDLREWPPGSITLVSHSVGAFVALGIARQLPAAVRGVVAVNGGLTTVARFIDAPLQQLLRHPVKCLGFLRLFALVAAPVPKKFKRVIASRRWSSRLVVGGLVSDSALDTIEQRQSLIVEAGKGETLLALRHNRHHWNEFVAYAGQIDVPVVFMVGDRDPMTTVADTETMARLLPHATVVVMPGVGHAAPLEVPDQVQAAIQNLDSASA